MLINVLHSLDALFSHQILFSVLTINVFFKGHLVCVLCFYTRQFHGFFIVCLLIKYIFGGERPGFGHSECLIIAMNTNVIILFCLHVSRLRLESLIFWKCVRLVSILTVGRCQYLGSPSLMWDSKALDKCSAHLSLLFANYTFWYCFVKIFTHLLVYISIKVGQVGCHSAISSCLSKIISLSPRFILGRFHLLEDRGRAFSPIWFVERLFWLI